MPAGWAALGAAVVGAGASMYAADKQEDAAHQASLQQGQSAQQGIDETRRQFDAFRELLQPYVQAGTGALTAQQNLIGLGGPEAQRAAIEALRGSEEFGFLTRQGEEGILANASATGGLRGGNTQSALAQFRPALLSAMITDRYNRLGGLVSIGQNAAAGVGNAGLATGSQVAGLYQQQGAAAAGGAMAQGRIQSNLASQLANSFGTALGGYQRQYTSPGVGGSYSNPSGDPGVPFDVGGNLGGPRSAGDFSDRRLKKNIRHIGYTERGNKLYEWEWKTGGFGRGVIAQEVEHIPGAVSADEDGILRVDYSKV